MSERSHDEHGYGPDELIRDWNDAAPDPEQLAAYVDGELDPVERGIVEGWLQDDPALVAELEQLRQLRAELGLDAREPSAVPIRDAQPRDRGHRSRRSRRSRRLRPAFRLDLRLAAGLAATLALAALGLVLLDGTRPSERILDGEAEIRLVNGRLDIRGDFPPDFAPAIKEALRSGRLPLPDSVGALRGRAGTLLTQDAPLTQDALQTRDADAPGPSPISPLGTFVSEARPLFRWRRVAGASAYRVTVADDRLRIVASSPALAESAWRPPAALPSGRRLTWQVSATTAEGTFRAPEPPAPEARFAVLTEAELSRLEARLERAGGSRLAMALAYLEAGMVGRARRELEVLAGEQRDPAWVERLRASLGDGGRP